jgi:hypothetical protein
MYLHAPGTDKVLEDQATLDFIAAAPDDIAALLAEVDRLRAALTFIADWAADCTFDENGSADTFYGFIQIEQQARAALDRGMG